MVCACANRWFVLTMKDKKLTYFKSDTTSSSKGVVDCNSATYVPAPILDPTWLPLSTRNLSREHRIWGQTLFVCCLFCTGKCVREAWFPVSPGCAPVCSVTIGSKEVGAPTVFTMHIITGDRTFYISADVRTTRTPHPTPQHLRAKESGILAM